MNCNFTILKKKSEIPDVELRAMYANEGMLFLLKNHYVEIYDYYEIEANKLIKALKTLGQYHRVVYIPPKDKANGVYKFYLDLFKED